MNVFVLSPLSCQSVTRVRVSNSPKNLYYLDLCLEFFPFNKISFLPSQFLQINPTWTSRRTRRVECLWYVRVSYILNTDVMPINTVSECNCESACLCSNRCLWLWVLLCLPVLSFLSWCWLLTSVASIPSLVFTVSYHTLYTHYV